MPTVVINVYSLAMMAIFKRFHVRILTETHSRANATSINFRINYLIDYKGSKECNKLKVKFMGKVLVETCCY